MWTNNLCFFLFFIITKFEKTATQTFAILDCLHCTVREILKWENLGVHFLGQQWTKSPQNFTDVFRWAPEVLFKSFSSKFENSLFHSYIWGLKVEFQWNKINFSAPNITMKKWIFEFWAETLKQHSWDPSKHICEVLRSFGPLLAEKMDSQIFPF